MCKPPAVDHQSRWMYFEMTMILINVTGRRNSFRSRIYLVDIGKRRLKVIPKVFPCQNVLEKHVFFHLEDLNACFQAMI